MKKLFNLITMRNLAVSRQRKRVFLSTLVVLALFLVLQLLPEPPALTAPIVTKTLSVSILVLVANILANAIRLLVVSRHRNKRGIANDDKDNFTVGMNALVNAATVIALIVIVFWVFDIEFRSFLNSIAIFAVALTLIFQEYIKNFLFGFSMMFSTDYEIGDYIQVGEMQKGVIVTLTFSSVHIKTETGDLLFVPNSVVRTHQVTNFSKLKPKRMTIEFSILRDQMRSVDKLEKQLLEHLQKKFPDTIDLDRSKLQVRIANKDEVTFLLELASRKSSLKLKEQINAAVQRFVVEYK